MYILGDIITVKENFFVPGSGVTWYYYRGSKYKIERYLEKWKEPAYKIVLVSGNGYEDGYFSVIDLNKKFHNIQKIRKEKISRIDELYNTR